MSECRCIRGKDYFSQPDWDTILDFGIDFMLECRNFWDWGGILECDF
jgi:hypothetical protein